MIFDALLVSLAGRIVAEQTQVTVNYIDSDQAVSIAGGGTSLRMLVIPGGRMMQVQFDMVCPSNDSGNLTFIEQYINCSDVQLGLTLAGNRSSAKEVGFLQRPSMTSSVGSNLIYGISWIGPQAVFR